jgi:predicted NAD/FAD-binding protein
MTIEVERALRVRFHAGSDNTRGVRVAIIGSGIAGLAAAHALAGAHDVVMYEAAARPGGHVYTVEANGVAVDMGFIVCNRERYPRFCRLLDELGIATRPTTMAFSVVDGGDEWGSESLSAVFADRKKLVDVRHWRFLVEIVRFLSRARDDLGTELAARASLDEYLEARDVSSDVRDRFVIPLAAALWSLGADHCGAFPAITYLRFLEQHGMLSPLRPMRWHTVVGGSGRYVDALLARLHATGRFTLELKMPVSSIVRDTRGATIVAGGGEARFDRVIVATHANTALALLAQPTDDERRVLGAFRYSTNRTVLHTDRTFLPTRAAAHAAWNYVADRDTARVAVTYSMTRLQGLPDVPYLVTLNPRREPAGVLHDVVFDHPQLDRAALAAQTELPRLNGVGRTYYAGAHFGFGFHEDGMRAGLAAASRAVADALGAAS